MYMNNFERHVFCNIVCLILKYVIINSNTFYPRNNNNYISKYNEVSYAKEQYVIYCIILK